MDHSKLDEVLDAFIKSHTDVILKNCRDPAVTEEYVSSMSVALKDRMKNQIVEEIKDQYRNELMQTVQEQNAISIQQEKISNICKIILESFALAFLVGLAVNEATNLVDLLKNAITSSDLLGSAVAFFVFFVSCILICLISYVSTALNIISTFNKQ